LTFTNNPEDVDEGAQLGIPRREKECPYRRESLSVWSLDARHRRKIAGVVSRLDRGWI